jgi:putative transposase
VLPKRQRQRLEGYDYSRAGAYFVTICLSPRVPLLGRVEAGAVRPSRLGETVAASLEELGCRFERVDLDLFVVMPDHIHAIVLLGDAREQDRVGLDRVVGTFKSISTRQVNATRHQPGEPLWQRGFFDHVIRHDEDLSRVREYIVTNPLRWEIAKDQRRVTDRCSGRAVLVP